MRNLPNWNFHWIDFCRLRAAYIKYFVLPKDPLADELREQCRCSVSSYPDIFNPDIAFLEVFAPGVSKASAVEKLKRMTGADRLTVFGDNINDLPMMAVADVAVAVGNALPEVKAAADIVIGSNRDDAVALYVERMSDGNMQN